MFGLDGSADDEQRKEHRGQDRPGKPRCARCVGKGEIERRPGMIDAFEIARRGVLPDPIRRPVSPCGPSRLVGQPRLDFGDNALNVWIVRIQL
jgi:hypothetical protein